MLVWKKEERALVECLSSSSTGHPPLYAPVGTYCKVENLTYMVTVMSILDTGIKMDFVSFWQSTECTPALDPLVRLLMPRVMNIEFTSFLHNVDVHISTVQEATSKILGSTIG
jgi:hypothetical protein